ncbi:TlpA family protein disulfide reductase [Alteromonas gilva]|uniref:TlpA disulfide reductase family protein n=1 Tax=Alteromonas gilva TaxID=2987522 RepID=A0ABT5KYS2_9ALTE|nr:TlpA disulfide reductase family protein [Alteromonas gilva]MDC8829783.1 TlpA disulfide reductase family protein [Alteromonas gilva]
MKIEDVMSQLRSFIIATGIALLSGLAYAQIADDPPPPAPAFTFNSLSGEQFEMPGYQQQKPTLLYFWATWCPYCKKATPRVVALHNDYREFINVLAINVGINDSVALTQQYIEDYDITFPVMFDHDSSVSGSYGVFGTPVFVIVSDDGGILYRGHRYPDGLERALSL